MHPNFRLLAAMNPGGEVGKKELPFKILNPFSVVRVNEPSSEEDFLEIV